jgi:hypothetical protein
MPVPMRMGFGEMQPNTCRHEQSCDEQRGRQGRDQGQGK